MMCFNLLLKIPLTTQVFLFIIIIILQCFLSSIKNVIGL